MIHSPSERKRHAVHWPPLPEHEPRTLRWLDRFIMALAFGAIVAAIVAALTTSTPYQGRAGVEVKE